RRLPWRLARLARCRPDRGAVRLRRRGRSRPVRGDPRPRVAQGGRCSGQVRVDVHGDRHLRAQRHLGARPFQNF
uniref:Uncharacterized protein n=1 Tax=Oryza brachyantha TaxID=4533 RepID=J3LEH6_ORYBR